MSGVELIIFGAGPAVGLAISLIAWVHEGYDKVRHQNQPQYKHDLL